MNIDPNVPINSLETIMIAHVIGELAATASSFYGKWCFRTDKSAY